MATSSNPLLQPGDIVFLVLRGDGEVPLQDGATLLQGTVQQVTWDEVALKYKYKVIWGDKGKWISEALYNAATGETITKTYNTARGAFRALVDSVNP